MKFRFALHDRVRHVLFHTEHDRYIGMVIERQWRESPGQAAAFYLVRFIDPAGEIDANPTCLSETELEPVEAKA
jgi:hypothetical protein